jgi:pantoate kinase
LQPRTALAFSPAVISNFFAIHNEGLALRPPNLAMVGATGGGFTLSKGVYTTAWIVPSASRGISVAVNGDADYPARTTGKAVELLLEGAGTPPLLVELVQTVEVPIGAGFGSSSASALSAVMAVAAALELPLSKEKIASFAHAADILRHTGLGTVSSTYDQSGAALVVHPGGPGVAKLRRVPVPAGLRAVTASLPQKAKPNLLRSKRLEGKINRLGEVALERASDLSFKSLLAAGHDFAVGLGMMSRGVERLVETALEAGAIGASQNMVGNSMHAVVAQADADTLVARLRSVSRSAKIDSFHIGGRRAQVLSQ